MAKIPGVNHLDAVRALKKVGLGIVISFPTMGCHNERRAVTRKKEAGKDRNSGLRGLQEPIRVRHYPEIQGGICRVEGRRQISP